MFGSVDVCENFCDRWSVIARNSKERWLEDIGISAARHWNVDCVLRKQYFVGKPQSLRLSFLESRDGKMVV